MIETRIHSGHFGDTSTHVTPVLPARYASPSPETRQIAAVIAAVADVGIDRARRDVARLSARYSIGVLKRRARRCGRCSRRTAATSAPAPATALPRHWNRAADRKTIRAGVLLCAACV